MEKVNANAEKIIFSYPGAGGILVQGSLLHYVSPLRPNFISPTVERQQDGPIRFLFVYFPKNLCIGFNVFRRFLLTRIPDSAKYQF